MRNLLTGIACLVGIACFVPVFVPFLAVRSQLDLLAGDGSAEPYSPAVHFRLQLCSAAIAVLGLAFTALQYFYAARISACAIALVSGLRRDLWTWWSTSRRILGEMWFEVFLMTGLATVLRVWWLNQPMRFDEAYTWLQYASWPWFIGISRYDDPNNHVFHTLCVHVVTRLLGSDPWVIRLPAFSAGILLVPAAMLWCRQLGCRKSALMTGALLACSSPLIEYSTNARGYTLLGLITCWLSVLAWRLVYQREFLSWLAFTVLAALGCWTIPVMAYPLFVIVIGWISAQLHPVLRARLRASFKWEALAGLTAAGCLTLVLYLPILITRGFGGRSENAMIHKFSWSETVERLPTSYLDSGALLFRDQNVFSLCLLAAGLLAAIVLGDVKKRAIRQCQMLSLATLPLVPFVQRVVPFPRIWLFLIPGLVILAMVGIQEVLVRIDKARQPGLVALVLAITCVWPLSRTISEDSVLLSLETGAAPDAEPVSTKLLDLLNPQEPVVAIVPVSAPLTYYCHRAGVPAEHLNPHYWRRETLRSALVVVSSLDQHSVRESLEVFQLAEILHPDTAELLVEYPTCQVYRVTRAP